MAARPDSVPGRNWRTDCAAVIPCVNEESTISELVNDVLQHVKKVIVVDDGGTDRTADLARRAGAEVLQHANNRGKGAALKTGWARARALGFQWALTLDGDGQHSPKDIPAFLQRVDESSAALVVGNRMLNPVSMPWVRRVVNRWMSRKLSRAAGRDLPDSQCGFRLINLVVLESMPLGTTHFEIESEVLLAFARAGKRINFVPVDVRYKSERSKIHPLLDTVRWFKWWRRQ